MKSHESFVEGIIGSRSIIDLTNNQLSYYRKRGKKNPANLSMKYCHPVVLWCVHYLNHLAKNNNLPRRSVFSAVISLGIHRLWRLRAVEETSEFQSWSFPRMEALKNTRFHGLESPGSKPVSIKYHAWVSENGERLAKSLGTEDSPAIIVLALISGLVFFEEIPQETKQEMFDLLREFSAWVDQRLIEVRKFYRLDENEADWWYSQRTSRSK